MAQADELVQQAIAAYKAGQKDHSRNLLLQAIEINEHHEQAWLWLSAVVDDLEEQQICLENVLALNPANERARKGLEAVNRKIAERQAAASVEDGLSLPDSDVSFAPPVERSSRGPIGAEFANVSGDSPFDGAPWAGPAKEPDAPARGPFEDWLSAAVHQADDLPFAVDDGPATSVDWGRPDAPAVYGSGRQVELPSAQEYDEWVRALNLVDHPDAAQAPGKAQPPESALSDGDVLDIAAINKPSPLSGGVSPFTEDVLAGQEPTPAFDSSISYDEDDWFTPEERARFGNVFTLDDDESEPSSEAPRFDFDADEPEDVAAGGDDDDAWLSERLGASVGASPAFSTSEMTAAVDARDYFAYIPAEIEAQSGVGGRSLLLLAAIAVLLVLNALSFGLLIF